MCLQNYHFHATNIDILEMQGSTFGSPRFPGSPRWCFQCGNTFSFCDVFLRFTALYRVPRIFARSALYFRNPPRKTSKSVRSAFRIIITFHRGGKRAAHRPWEPRQFEEKISSDPGKYRCEVRLAIHNGHHRDPVLDTDFGHFWKTYDK